MPDGKAALLHLVSDAAAADPGAIRATLDRIRADVRQRVLLGTRRTPGATWPDGAPPAIPATLLAGSGRGAPAPVPERDAGLLERVLAALRSHGGADAPAPSRTVRARGGTT
jgi:hypothetical protein